MEWESQQKVSFALFSKGRENIHILSAKAANGVSRMLAHPIGLFLRCMNILSRLFGIFLIVFNLVGPSEIVLYILCFTHNSSDYLDRYS